MATATQERKKATRRSRKTDVEAWRTDAGELWWRCPDCRSSHDSSVRACNCGRVRPTLETLIAQMPEQQAKATDSPHGSTGETESAEAAVGAPPLKSGVKVNEFGVVVKGAKSFGVKFNSARRIESRISYCEVHQDRWGYAITVNARWPNYPSGRSGPISINAVDCQSKEECLVRGFHDIDGWLRTQYKTGDQPHTKRVNAALSELSDLREKAGIPHFVQWHTGQERAAESVNDEIDTPPDVAATEDVPIKLVTENPVNTRCNWGDLDGVAESMQRVGQLQECTGRRKGKRVELICGNRRYRAAKLAGLQTLRVRIVECDDLTALDIMGEENEKQHTWDAISRAAWLQAEREARGLSTRQLAEHLQVSQADVANHLRLLKLPKAWQQRVISGEITSTQARSLATWADRPAVLKAMQRTLKDSPDLSSSDFDRELNGSVRELTRPCEKGDWYGHSVKGGYRSGECLFTKKQLEQWREELDVVTLTWRNGRKEQRAFNLKRWDELHGPLEKNAQERADARASRKASGAKGASSKSGELNAADRKHRAEQQRKQLATKVWRYKVRWLQQRAAEAVLQAEGYVGVKLLLAFAATPDARGERRSTLAAVIRDAGGKSKSSGYHGIDAWASLATLATDTGVTEVAKQALAAWLVLDPFDFRAALHGRDVVLAAHELGVDLQRDWRVERQFLELFTKDQLRDLAKEWKLLPKLNPGDKRGDRVRVLLQADQAKRLPAPKSLIKAKG